MFTYGYKPRGTLGDAHPVTQSTAGEARESEVNGQLVYNHVSFSICFPVDKSEHVVHFLTMVQSKWPSQNGATMCLVRLVQSLHTRSGLANETASVYAVLTNHKIIIYTQTGIYE